MAADRVALWLQLASLSPDQQNNSCVKHSETISLLCLLQSVCFRLSTRVKISQPVNMIEQDW